jgi:hypothetical protein
MPEGYVRLNGSGPREVLACLQRRQRERMKLAITNAGRPWQPGRPFVDMAARATPRQEAFDFGDHPLPGYSWPPPRWTGWECER